MSGLLRRLASQAVAGGTPRVRAAASLRRPPPIVMPSGSERSDVALGLGRDATQARRRDVPSRRFEGVTESPVAQAEPLLIEPTVGRHAAQGPEREPMAVPPLLPERAPTFDPVRPEPLLASEALQIRYPDEPRASESGYSRDAEPTEVHVHIGRIEVTAVHEAGARRGRREPQRPTPTLEDYLAGRPRRAT